MRIRAVLGILVLALPLVAQQATKDIPGADAPDPDDVKPPTPEVLRQVKDVVHRQFGQGFSLAEDSPTPVLLGDFDGDGVEDMAAVVAAKKPPKMLSSAGYQMIDPYDEFFGYGNPRMTNHFSAGDQERVRYLLIVHGAGAEAWRAKTPKSKFVVINLPLDKMGIVPLTWKKKHVNAIELDETSVMSSLLFWDGKRYRWEPGDLSD